MNYSHVPTSNKIRTWLIRIEHLAGEAALMMHIDLPATALWPERERVFNQIITAYEIQESRCADLIDACKDAIVSLEYVNRNHPEATGGGAREDLVLRLRALIAKVQGRAAR